MEIIPAAGLPLGAEIRGLDIARTAGPEAGAAVKEALGRHGVVYLRNQRLTPEQQIAFSAHFGTLEGHVLPQYLVPGHPELMRVSNILDDAGKPIGLIDAGRVWHSDGAFQERPNMYSMLYAIEVPTDDAGEPLGATLFASTADAYDTLPAATKARIDGLRAVNSLAAVYESLRRLNVASKRAPLTEEQKREVVHPVVRTHPDTGRKCLYVSRAATLRIVGMAEEESLALIGELSDWCVRGDRVYRHRWQVGDVLLWDNCSTQHFAVGDYGPHQRRLMHRTTVGGSVPF